MHQISRPRSLALQNRQEKVAPFQFLDLDAIFFVLRNNIC